jgi:beta-glucosidase
VTDAVTSSETQPDESGSRPGDPLSAWNGSEAVERRIADLLQRMTLEEKVDFVTGDLNFNYGFYNGPIDRLEIPALTMADGPAGVRINRGDVHESKATALPAPIALAATWDPELATRYGDVLGAEALASGHNVQLAPAVDIARVATGGRTFESFGEDPLLQARIAVPEIHAIQAHPVQACIKHYAVNNQEYERSSLDAEIDERTLQEVYLPPFAAAVKDGQVASAMGAFNKVNGVFACENAPLLQQVLREQWGFRGWVMSDYGANHSLLESANNGLDQEQPTAGEWGAKLLDAVQDGQVALDAIDDKVRNILRPLVGLGQLETRPAVTDMAVEAHGDVARQVAERAMVLLQNNGVLPLDPKTVSSLAVIGPDADNVSAAGGGSGLVKPTYGVSALDGIRRRAADANLSVEFAPGTDPISAGALLPGPDPVPSAVLAPLGAGAGDVGLRGEYWANPSFDGEPLLTRVDPQVDLNLGFFNFPGFNASSPKLPETPTELNGQISVRWAGTLTAPSTGDYELAITSLGTTVLYLDGQQLINTAGLTERSVGTGEPAYPYGQHTLHSSGAQAVTETVTVSLTEGAAHEIRIDYAADTPEQGHLTGAQIRLAWMPPAEVVLPTVQAAADLARRCDAAVVVVRTYETEAMDRPHLRLPNGQETLIREVAKANPRVVVVLMTGGPVETASWQGEAAAVIQAWYAGQEQGNALAAVLFGDAGPSGKLPWTLPAAGDRTPISTPEQYPGVGGVVSYSEGVFVGYRGYDELEIDPAFPFGHGLSYTSFGYTDLQVSNPSTTADDVQVSFRLANTGDRAGREVAQVYVGRLPADIPTPLRQLAGFVSVELQPGADEQLEVAIPRQCLSYWDVAAGGWVTPPGAVQVHVGASSRDIRLSGVLQLADG